MNPGNKPSSQSQNIYGTYVSNLLLKVFHKYDNIFGFFLYLFFTFDRPMKADIVTLRGSAVSTAKLAYIQLINLMMCSNFYFLFLNLFLLQFHLEALSSHT